MSRDEQMRHVERLQAEIDAAKAQCEAVAGERDALQVQLAQVAQGASSQSAQVQAMLAEQEAAEKARRVELIGKQAIRRILHEGLSRGFGAWRELAEARSHALATMKRVARRLKSAQVWGAFAAWRRDLDARKARSSLGAALATPQKLGDELERLTARIEQMRDEYERSACQGCLTQCPSPPPVHCTILEYMDYSHWCTGGALSSLVCMTPL